MDSLARIAALYTLFATIATVANLASQAAIIGIYAGSYSVEISIMVGTVVGLPIKYVLEKRYIFAFTTTDISHDGKLFLLYSCLGLVTTALFWTIEYLFHWLFGTDMMRYLGGAIGLTLGYAIKYRLDRRFVFVARSPATARAA